LVWVYSDLKLKPKLNLKLRSQTRNMEIIQAGKSNILIPGIAARYRANCHGEWGSFVKGKTKGLKFSEAEKQGFIFGNFVELIICKLGQKILTFDPHYTNEEFLEIWGVPVAGAIKEQYPGNSSELMTFLIHRQSKDDFMAIVEGTARHGFVEWMNGDKKQDPKEFAKQKVGEVLSQNAFRFEMQKEYSDRNKVNYFCVQCSSRPVKSEFEKDVVAARPQIEPYCTDPQIEANHQACLAIAGVTAPQPLLVG